MYVYAQIYFGALLRIETREANTAVATKRVVLMSRLTFLAKLWEHIACNIFHQMLCIRPFFERLPPPSSKATWARKHVESIFLCPRVFVIMLRKDVASSRQLDAVLDSHRILHANPMRPASIRDRAV